MGGVRLTLRVDFGTDRAIGPGKILLLEAIRDTGSISQAGRALGMSYRRAWLLVDDMNQCFREPVVTAQPGGSQGGGAAPASRARPRSAPAPPGRDSTVNLASITRA